MLHRSLQCQCHKPPRQLCWGRRAASCSEGSPSRQDSTQAGSSHIATVRATPAHPAGSLPVTFFRDSPLCMLPTAYFFADVAG